MASRLPARILSLPLRARTTLHPISVRTYANSKEPSGDYGSGTGDPKGEKPQEQGANPSADLEHPGPPPPKAGQGSGGATKKGAEGHNTSDAHQGGQKRGFATYAAARFRTVGTVRSEARPKSTEGLKPKILDQSPPSESEAPEEVKQHNKEVKGRAERATEGVGSEDVGEKDNVGKEFWKGHAGAHQEKQ